MLRRDIEKFCEELEQLLKSGRQLLQEMREQDEKEPPTAIFTLPANTFEKGTGEFRLGSALVRIVEPSELDAHAETDE